MSFATVMLTTQRLTGTSFCMDEAMHYADALLAELDRTAPKPEAPSPDDDGWIPHRPGDRRPNFDGRVEVRYQNGETDSDEVYGFHWGKHSGGFLNPEYAIIAWKPA